MWFYWTVTSSIVTSISPSSPPSSCVAMCIEAWISMKTMDAPVGGGKRNKYHDQCQYSTMSGKTN